MAKSDLVNAKVAVDNYHFRGRKIQKGRIVQVTRSALEEAALVQPPYLVPATSAEVKRSTVAELPDYEPPAEETEPPATGKRKG
jgi:hypothetical protein